MRARVAVGLMLLSLVAAAPVAAQGAGGQGFATESLSATGLSITAQIGYEKAMLRVTGPGGFHGRQTFEAGAAIQVDLVTLGTGPSKIKTQRPKAKTEAVEKAAMPDGRYKFEVVFYAKGRKVGIHSGMFFVEGGVAISREAKRAQLTSLRGDLARDRQSLAARAGRAPMSTEGPSALSPTKQSSAQSSVESPLTEAGYFTHFVRVNHFSPAIAYYTWLSLENYVVYDQSYRLWMMAHYYGDLTFGYGAGGYNPHQMTLEPAATPTGGPKLGIGTTVPDATLDVNGFPPDEYQLGITGPGGYRVAQSVGGSGLWFYDNDYEPIVTFNHAAGPLSLVVDAYGVGIGDFGVSPYYPAVDLHVRDAEAQVLVESTGSTSGRTLAYMKNPGDVRMFWENTDSGDIWQMSLLSTVLQIATPTGDGKFRVRKNGGLQALRGSTTILDLDSVGNLEVTSVTQTSSREVKQGFEAVNGLSVLEKVAALPISKWSYKSDSPSIRHMGPMSEDFHAAFGLGKDDKGLTTIATSGVALAAIQGLIEANATLEERISELEELVLALAEN